ncbi:unnamed protein product [Diamesa tonsa]
MIIIKSLKPNQHIYLQRLYNLIINVILAAEALTLIDGASKWYTGDNKPYEFGYAIEGNQHRHESKDANGLIMGEFGFITADDVYHVTVYATDENGNFKIISMKNIKLMKGPPPQVITPKATAPTPTSTTPKPFTVKTIAANVTPKASNEAACASCKLPSPAGVNTSNNLPVPEKSTVDSSLESGTTKVPPPFKVVSKDAVTTISPTVSQVTEALPQKLVQQNLSSRFGSNEDVNNKQNQLNKSSDNKLLAPKSMQLDTRNPNDLTSHTMPKFFNKLNGNADAYNKVEKLMNGLLYRFNYTTDFQGHNEEGDRSGNKDGEYYSIGRDNIKRIVTYKANEFGFMPYIRQEQVKPEEQQLLDEQNNKLKGYKFEWFYPR